MKNKTVVICMFLMFIFCGSGYFADRYIRAKSTSRSSMFISIDWKLKREISIEGESPSELIGFVENYYSSYISVFPEGLKYTKINHKDYLLEEKKDRCISLFVKDRLISKSGIDPSFFKSGSRAER